MSPWKGQGIHRISGQPGPLHRITECLGLEGTSRIVNLQPPCYMQDHQPPHFILDQAAQGPIQPGLNTSRDGRGIHSLSGQLFQHLTTLSVKNFPLTSNLNLPSLNLKRFPLSLAVKDIFLISNLNFPFFFPLGSPLGIERLLPGHLGAFTSPG